MLIEPKEDTTLDILLYKRSFKFNRRS